MSAFFATLAILLLSLGQLQRVSLNPSLAFYCHDVAIAIFLLVTTVINRRQLWKYVLKLHRLLLKNRPFLISIIITVLMIFFSWFWHEVRLMPVLYLLRLMAYALFIIYNFRLKIFSAAQLRDLVLASLGIFAVLGVVQYVVFPDAYWLKFLGWDEHYHRLFSTLLDPNFAGMIFVLTMTALLNMRPWRWWHSLCLGLLLVVLLLTYSRASYLAFAVVLGLWLVKKISVSVSQKSKKTRRVRPTVVVTLILIVSTALAIFLTRPVTQSDSTNLARTSTIAIRVNMAWQQLQSLRGVDLIIGRGFFVALPTPVHRSADTNFTINTAAFPDNFFLLLLSFFGLPITILVLHWLLKILIWAAKNNYTIFMLLSGVLVHSQFNNTVFEPFVFLYLGLLIVIELQNNRPVIG